MSEHSKRIKKFKIKKINIDKHVKLINRKY